MILKDPGGETHDLKYRDPGIGGSTECRMELKGTRAQRE